MDKNTNKKKSSEDNFICPIRYSLDIIGGKWKLPILCMLASGNPTRYSSIKRKLGNITNMMLAQSLKELESMGMVHREQYNEVPPRVEYSLTEKGNSIIPILVQLGEWGADNMQSDSLFNVKCSECQSTE